MALAFEHKMKEYSSVQNTKITLQKLIDNAHRYLTYPLT